MHFTESVADEALDAAWADSLERAKARRGGCCRQEKE
jgi:hypothetical protein